MELYLENVAVVNNYNYYMLQFFSQFRTGMTLVKSTIVNTAMTRWLVLVVTTRCAA
jgi:hypothetical protein